MRPGAYVFGPFRLEPDERRLSRDGEVVPLRGKTFEFLLLLVENAGKLLTKQELLDAVWPDVVVEENNLAYNVSLLRKALSNAPGISIDTVRGTGYRLVAEVREEGPTAPRATDATAATGPGPRDADGRPLHQEIRFCTTPDDVRLAWAKLGSGPPIVKVANWLSHLELDWGSPIWPHWLEALGRRRTLIRYDARGTGLSDRDVAEISFAAFLRDLEVVVDAAGVSRFVLVGISQGAGVAVAYAAAHPERVSALVLIGGWVRGWRAKRNAKLERRVEAIMTLMRDGWGRENAAFRQIWTTTFFPGASKEQMDWFNELQRETTTPESAVRITEAAGRIDVREALARVSAPTVVFHSRGDSLVPMRNGVELAAGIPGARFVPLESKNHLLLADEPAWPRFADELERFLAAHGS